MVSGDRQALLVIRVTVMFGASRMYSRMWVLLERLRERSDVSVLLDAIMRRQPGLSVTSFVFTDLSYVSMSVILWTIAWWEIFRVWVSLELE